MILGQFFTEIAENGLIAMLVLIKWMKLEKNELFGFTVHHNGLDLHSGIGFAGIGFAHLCLITCARNSIFFPLNRL